MLFEQASHLQRATAKRNVRIVAARSRTAPIVADTAVIPECGGLVDGMGLEPTASSLRTRRSPS